MQRAPWRAQLRLGLQREVLLVVVHALRGSRLSKPTRWIFRNAPSSPMGAAESTNGTLAAPERRAPVKRLRLPRSVRIRVHAVPGARRWASQRWRVLVEAGRRGRAGRCPTRDRARDRHARRRRHVSTTSAAPPPKPPRSRSTQHGRPTAASVSRWPRQTTRSGRHARRCVRSARTRTDRSSSTRRRRSTQRRLSLRRSRPHASTRATASCSTAPPPSRSCSRSASLGRSFTRSTALTARTRAGARSSSSTRATCTGATPASHWYVLDAAHGRFAGEPSDADVRAQPLRRSCSERRRCPAGGHFRWRACFHVARRRTRSRIPRGPPGCSGRGYHGRRQPPGRASRHRRRSHAGRALSPVRADRPHGVRRRRQRRPAVRLQPPLDQFITGERRQGDAARRLPAACSTPAASITSTRTATRSCIR